MRAFVCLTVAMVAVLCFACDRRAPAAASRPTTAKAAIAQVHLRQTTDAELRATLGEPDEQTADGALVYRFVGAGARRSETETVRFAFERGKLSRICRNRS